MTLAELKAIVPAADSNKRVPSISAMLEEGKHIVVKNRINVDTEITVYDNGYVVYKAKDRATVFPLHTCEEYIYELQDGEQPCVSSDVFEQESWEMRLVMEGEDRLEYNQNQRMKNYNRSYHAVSEDWIELADRSNDPLEIFAEISEKEEKRKLLIKLFSELSPRQKDTIIACVIKRKSRRILAEELGISIQAVTDALMKGMEKLKSGFHTDF